MRFLFVALPLLSCGSGDPATPRDAGEPSDAAHDDGCPECTVVYGAPVLVARGAPGTTQREPSVAVDSEGTIWLAYADYAERGVNSAVMRVVRSTDHGETFEPVGSSICGHDNCGNPLLAVDSEDRVFLSFGALDLGGAGPRWMLLTRVDDGAAEIVTVSDDPEPKADRQWLAVGPGDELYVAWKRGYQDAEGEIRIARSDDHGRTFGASRPVVGDIDVARPLYAAIAVASSGEVLVAVVVGSIDYRQVNGVWFTRSTDGGATFSPPIDLGATASAPIPGPFGQMQEDGAVFVDFPVIAVAPDGLVHVAWPQQSIDDAEDIDVVVASSADGVSFAEPVVVNDDPGPTLHVQPAIATDEVGLVHVAWMDARAWDGVSNAPWRIFASLSRDRGVSYLASVDLGAPTFAGNQGIQEGAQAIGEFNGLAARGGSVFVAWTDSHSGDPDVYLAVGRRQDAP